MTTEDDSRESGVEIGELEDDLEDHDYPATAEELVEAYGDREIDLPDGGQSFSDLLDPYLEEDEETFEDAEEVRQAIFNLVPREAVGRERYSDRGEDPDSEQESF